MKVNEEGKKTGVRMHLIGATQSTSCHSLTYNLWFVFRLLLLSSGYNTGATRDPLDLVGKCVSV